jgi:hypothetical protein
MRNFFLPLCAIFFSGLLASVPAVGQAGEVPRVGFATAALDATRFADSDVSTTSVPAGSEVEVLAESGNKVRIRYQTSFGWVAASDITSEAPVAADSVQLDLKGPPSFR